MLVYKKIVLLVFFYLKKQRKILSENNEQPQKYVFQTQYKFKKLEN
jgi:hypothetical protein